MAVLLSQVCALQKTYGKSQDEIETLVEGFAWALDGFEMPEIMEAMRSYILSKNDMPAPADILVIIKENRFMREMRAITPENIARWKRYQEKGIALSEYERKALMDFNDDFRATK